MKYSNVTNLMIFDFEFPWPETLTFYFDASLLHIIQFSKRSLRSTGGLKHSKEFIANSIYIKYNHSQNNITVVSHKCYISF